jgi:prolyl oligopeptidase
MLLLLLACGPKDAPTAGTGAQLAAALDLAERGDVVDTLHGVAVADPYRWMEDADSEAVQAWTGRRNAAFDAYTDGLSQREWLYGRFQHLWRYDDESTPDPCLLSDKIVYETKKADQDKWVVHIKDGPDATGRVVLDPNTWGQIETLAFFSPSPDCSLVAFGKSQGGDENPVISVMDLTTGELLPDTFRGWKQGWVSWKHDSSGFYYTAKPLASEVEVQGDHEYWHRVWEHAVGTTAESDTLIHSDPDVRETWHGVWMSEDGKWRLFYRGLFNVNRLWIEPADGSGPKVAMTEHMDFEYDVEVSGDRAIIKTDWDAPNYRVMVADAAAPQQENWTELIPESADKLDAVSVIGGHLYATYQHNAATEIVVYTLDGEKKQTIELPTVGTARVWGYASKPEVWLSFSSFAHPSTVYTYDVEENSLTLYKESPIDIDPSNIGVEQVWYESKDGTKVSMFVIRDVRSQGPIPFLLTGYGGFNISLTPGFSTRNAVWLEAGGGVAIPNLRGGGEYGQAWHEAGMREHKQNVFDDFIAAGEWLISSGNTTADQLAISGGSNGGLLVSAAVTQRPELFEAVLCAVPLTDMVRFHKFGLANIWTEEYGSADDAEMFPYIHAYSPYHSVRQGTDYPAILVTGSENDARTDPVHARKFMAAVHWADTDHGTEEPILLHIQSDSGHGGAVTIDQSADQYARHYGFLMAQIGMEAPVAAE